MIELWLLLLKIQIQIQKFIIILFNYLIIIYLLANNICGNDFTQHIPLHKPRRSRNKPKPIPDYHPD